MINIKRGGKKAWKRLWNGRAGVWERLYEAVVVQIKTFITVRIRYPSNWGESRVGLQLHFQLFRLLKVSKHGTLSNLNLHCNKSLAAKSYTSQSQTRYSLQKSDDSQNSFSGSETLPPSDPLSKLYHGNRVFFFFFFLKRQKMPKSYFHPVKNGNGF